MKKKNVLRKTNLVLMHPVEVGIQKEEVKFWEEDGRSR